MLGPPLHRLVSAILTTILWVQHAQNVQPAASSCLIKPLMENVIVMIPKTWSSWEVLACVSLDTILHYLDAIHAQSLPGMELTHLRIFLVLVILGATMLGVPLPINAFVMLAITLIQRQPALFALLQQDMLLLIPLLIIAARVTVTITTIGM
jgi:hypothetical protein